MLRTLVRRIIEWVNIRHDITRLDRLDDHLLADIGIERNQIEAFVHGRIEKPADGVLPEWAEPQRRTGHRAPSVARPRRMVPAE